MGDFRPYLLKSTDRGRTWTSIAGNLPERGTVYALAEDHVDPGLLFAGTEFGLFFTRDGGRHWVQLRGGLPTIQVRDLAIQKQENDLVVGTFGRGIWILDDYTPLRHGTPERLAGEGFLFPVEPARTYSLAAPLGYRDKAFQGDSFFAAPNPPLGAVFSLYLKDEVKTRRKVRQDREKEIEKAGGTLPYPTPADLRAEAAEEEPALLVTIADAEGQVIRRLKAPATAGIHRIAWDLRWPPADPTDLTPPTPDNPYVYIPQGPRAAPGTYRVSLAKRVDGKETPLGEPQTFEVRPLGEATLAAADRTALQAFVRKAARLQRAVYGALATLGEAQSRISHLKQALLDTPGADPRLGDEARSLEARLRDVSLALVGDNVLSGRNEPTPPAVLDRIGVIVESHWSASTEPTRTSLDAYEIAAAEFAPVLDDLRRIVDNDLRSLEQRMESAGAPWTPGRLPVWSRE